MENCQHKDLEGGGWSKIPFPRQMANIGSETYRSVKWLEKNNMARAEQAFERALELIDLTIRYGRLNDSSKRGSLLKELCRFRAAYCNAFQKKEILDIKKLNKYLDHFSLVN